MLGAIVLSKLAEVDDERMTLATRNKIATLSKDAEAHVIVAKKFQENKEMQNAVHHAYTAEVMMLCVRHFGGDSVDKIAKRDTSLILNDAIQVQEDAVKT